MTAPPGRKPRPFGPDELDGVAGLRPDELAAEARLARDLEGIAARGRRAPSSDFTDRVMAAVAAEPVPAPVIAAGSALRHGAALGFLASLRDSFRVAFGGGFPVAVRAQALRARARGGRRDGRLGSRDRGGHGAPRRPWLAAPGPSVAAPSPSQLPSATPMPTDTPDGDLRGAVAVRRPRRRHRRRQRRRRPRPSARRDRRRRRRPGTESDRTPAPTRTATPTTRPRRRPTPTDAPDDPDETETPEPADTPRPTDTPDPDDSPSPTSDRRQRLIPSAARPDARGRLGA